MILQAQCENEHPSTPNYGVQFNYWVSYFSDAPLPSNYDIRTAVYPINCPSVLELRAGPFHYLIELPHHYDHSNLSYNLISISIFA